MRPRIRKLAVVVGTTALFGGAVAGCGSSSSNDATAAGGSATTAQAARSGQDGAGPGAMFSATTLKTLATELGVSTTALQKAMASARPSGGPPAQGDASSAAPSGTSAQADPRTQMAAAIAKALGLSETKVAAALKAVMPSPPSGQDAAPPSGTTAAS